MVVNERPRKVYNVLRVEGMPPGQGRRIPPNFSGTPADRTTGSGTLSDPYVTWVHDLSDAGQRVIRRCTEIVREEAIKLQMTYAWVRSINHSLQTGRSTSGVPVLRPAQSHITVCFGTSASTLLWEGHIWTKNMADKSGAPQRILYPSEVREAGGNPKLWASGPYPYSFLPDGYPYPFKLNFQDRMVVYKLPPTEYHTEPQEPPHD
ncbi:hypothetical protein F4776DRAFT_673713 [Hypoxylon sp. NC0597]|nr:hypothetical protein F4776DRAFT_673713 [Hypoxylon sp. NC0597]